MSNRRHALHSIVVLIALSCVAAVLGTASVARAADDAPGLRVYVDPQTGAFTGPPEAANERAAGIRPDVVPTPPAAAEPVVEAAPGGGVMVNLGDRLQHEMRLDVTGDDVHTRCVMPGQADAGDAR